MTWFRTRHDIQRIKIRQTLQQFKWTPERMIKLQFMTLDEICETPWAYIKFQEYMEQECSAHALDFYKCYKSKTDSYTLAYSFVNQDRAINQINLPSGIYQLCMLGKVECSLI